MNQTDGFSRRTLLQIGATAFAAATLPGARAGSAKDQDIESALRSLEQRGGGRLGVAIVDGDRHYGNRADERFGLCSTFKLLLAAVVLHEAQLGRLALDEPLALAAADKVPYMPVTTRHLGGVMSVAELARAAQMTSDNLAANLLLKHLGGPAALTEKLRALGDDTTRIDRTEPEMNLVLPGDERDTTTPAAMAATVRRLFTSDSLSPVAKATLKQWMIETRTGQRRLRKGFPEGWVAGNKTGTGVHSSMVNRHNDVAVVWRENAAPLVVAAYYEADAYYPNMRAEEDAVLAAVGAIVARLG